MPSKSVLKTPYELMTGRRPILKHLCVLDCKAEVRPYKLEIKKLDHKTISGFFVGYNTGTRGCRFYCSNHSTRIIEFDRVVYLEGNSRDYLIMQPHTIEFRGEHFDIPLPIAPIVGTIPFELVHNDVVNPIIDANVDHIVQGDVPNLDVIEFVRRRSGRVSTSTKYTRFKDYSVYL